MIDASVIMECPPGPTTNPALHRVFSFLRAFRQSPHIAAGTRDTFREWVLRNQYVVAWRQELFQRGRLLTVPANNRFGERVERSVADPIAKREILKDVHLVEAAVATDRRVVSADDRARAYMRRAVDVLHECSSVVWVNPVAEDEGATQWLQKGAPDDPGRVLVPR